MWLERMVEVVTVDPLRGGWLERMVEVVTVDSLRVGWIWMLDLRLLMEATCGEVVFKCSISLTCLGIAEFSGSFEFSRLLNWLREEADRRGIAEMVQPMLDISRLLKQLKENKKEKEKRTKERKNERKKIGSHI